jgi:hypothetical protein
MAPLLPILRDAALCAAPQDEVGFGSRSVSIKDDLALGYADYDAKAKPFIVED